MPISAVGSDHSTNFHTYHTCLGNSQRNYLNQYPDDRDGDGHGGQPHGLIGLEQRPLVDAEDLQRVWSVWPRPERTQLVHFWVRVDHDLLLGRYVNDDKQMTEEV